MSELEELFKTGDGLGTAYHVRVKGRMHVVCPDGSKHLERRGAMLEINPKPMLVLTLVFIALAERFLYFRSTPAAIAETCCGY